MNLRYESYVDWLLRQGRPIPVDTYIRATTGRAWQRYRDQQVDRKVDQQANNYLVDHGRLK